MLLSCVGVYYMLGPHYRFQGPITNPKRSQNNTWGPFIAFGGTFVNTCPTMGPIGAPNGIFINISPMMEIKRASPHTSPIKGKGEVESRGLCFAFICLTLPFYWPKPIFCWSKATLWLSTPVLETTPRNSLLRLKVLNSYHSSINKSIV